MLPLLVLLLLLPTSCARRAALLPLPSAAFPRFSDDLHYARLEEALVRSLHYLRGRPAGATLALGDRLLPVSRLIDSLLAFQSIIADHPRPDELDHRIRDQFRLLQATGTSGFNPDREMLVTGYYQPVFAGSLTRKAPYLYPLYTIPDDLVIRHDPRTGARKTGRLQGGKFLDYWSRGEIETQHRARGHELVWLRDPLDAFFLHVQGSGLIRLPDGTIRGVHYAISNGRRYSSIGKYLVDQGRITLKEASLASIRSYINTHPDERDKILHHNKSFIFFNWNVGRNAIGNLGEPLTPGRSIAMDQQCFPAGGLAFLCSRKPVLDDRDRRISWAPLNRFVLVQDKGSAIRGPGRIDLFWGTGDRAGAMAGQMKETGTLYFLLVKENHEH